MKKLTAILLCIAMFMSLAACAEAPAETEVSATPTAKNLFPAPKPTSTPAPKLSPTEKRETVTEDGRPIIYIGSFSSGSFEIEDSFTWLNKMVRNFNYKWEKEYELRIVDYGDAKASDAYYRLNSEIISGKMPDMLVTHSMPVDNYAKLGLLYDMSDWLDPEEFYTGPLEAMRTEDGKLYEVSPLITVTSFYGLTKYLGTEGALSLADIYAAWEKFNVSGDKAFIAGLSNELICMLLVSAYEQQFVDKTAATCNFNSAEFIELLEFCSKLPAHPPELDVKSDLGWSVNHWFMTESPDLRRAITVRKEEALLGIMATQRHGGFQYNPHQFMLMGLYGMDYRFIGYPGANTASVYLEYPLSVSAKATSLEGVQLFVDDLWGFVPVFTGKIVNGIYQGGPAPNIPDMIPLKRTIVEANNKYWLTEMAFQRDIADDINYGDDVLYWGAGLFWGTPYYDDDAQNYTLEQFAELEEIINSASVRVKSPIVSYLPPFTMLQLGNSRRGSAPPASSLADPILAEEIQSYFAGIQDVKRTAELIQSRYSVYLSEAS
jgi:hypothetical protein